MNVGKQIQVIAGEIHGEGTRNLELFVSEGKYPRRKLWHKDMEMEMEHFRP